MENFRAVPDEKNMGTFEGNALYFCGGCFFYQSSVWLSCLKMQLCRWLFFSTMQFCGYPSFKVNLVGCLGRMRKTSYNSVKGGSTEKKELCAMWVVGLTDNLILWVVGLNSN